MSLPDPEQRAAYYRAAMSLLRFVEQRAPTQRRFGPEADALWRSFAGDLDRADRVDLLLRDADRQWGAAFGARTVFSLEGVHELDAFGADWPGLSASEAEALWRSREVPDSREAALTSLLAAWQVREPARFEIGKLGPSSRIAVAGLAAILACARRFSADADLSWPNQVVVIADSPSSRHLALALPALVDFGEATYLLRSEQVAGARARIRERLGVLEAIVSPDASLDERNAVATLRGS